MQLIATDPPHRHASAGGTREAAVGAPLLTLLVPIAIGIGVARRLILAPDGPLTLDESWTGAIAAAADLSTLVDRCLAELSGPVYYGLVWAWAQLAGTENAMLRLPSLAAALATPLLVLRWGHPDRTTRRLWAGLIAVWLPATLFAAEARPYSLVLLLGTAQVCALIHLLRQPSRRRAWAWAALAALSILTHYHALPVTALQGLLIMSRGRQAWRCWPALAAFLPVVGWMAIHLPTLLTFAAPGGNWYVRADPADLATIVPTAMFGFAPLGYVLLAGFALSAIANGPLTPQRRRDLAVALTGVVAVALLVVLALVRPSFSPRYLLPAMPPILFGLAAWGAAWSRRRPWLPVALLSAFLLLACAEAGARRTPPAPRDGAESFEPASAALAATGPRRLIVFFDGPGTINADPALLRDVGGFFVRRAGRSVTVIAPAFADPGVDPNRALPSLADRPDDAILWIYGAATPGTHGARFPAAIERHDGRFRCRDFGVGSLAVIACSQTSGGAVG